MRQMFNQTSHSKDKFDDQTSIKRFDQIDFIVADVPANILPWQEKMLQLTQLFKQCKYTEKPILLMGSGIAQLVYYCSTESAKYYVINGQELGGSLTKIKTAVEPELLKQLKMNLHVYLDNLSGDIFSFDLKKKAWIPIGNVGFHERRAKASIQGGRDVGHGMDPVARL